MNTNRTIISSPLLTLVLTISAFLCARVAEAQHQVESFPVGDGPEGVAFDGASIWVGNTISNNVTKLRASDGAPQGVFPVDAFPQAVAFDGRNIWVASLAADTVTKLRPRDGAVLGVFPVGSGPSDITFDGSYT